jgi:DNA (cytosine-5)-methyltransferase 1
MKYLSICSGIEAASVAFEPLGWRPLAFSEIEAFPRAVLKHHYPDTPCHGDFTLLKDEPWIVDADMLCGGTPCQAFSVAGNRQSLADDRGNLTLQFVLLADAIDHLRSTAGREPAWILWENVPGVLSTNDNAFGAFLGGLVGRTAPIPEPADGWTGAGVVDGPTRCAAWRILDAQHFGLAQRRKRVFVLARGGAGRWAVADALLPIIEGSGWHPAPSRGTGKGVARGAAQGFAASSIGQYREGNQLGTLRANGGDIGGGSENLIAHTQRGAYLAPHIPEVTRPLTAAMGTKWNGNGDLESSLIPSIVGTLTANMVGCAGTPGYNETEHILPLPVRMREGKEGGGKGPLVSEDQSLTLATGNDQVLAFKGGQGSGAGSLGASEYVSPTLGAADSGSNRTPTLMLGMQVRRLTPMECERLQGFPDGYTNIPWRGKPESPDGPRYKALGNSWAVPCARWIGECIKAIRP